MPTKKSKRAKQRMPLTVICRFTVKPSREKQFLKVLAKDWPGLVKLGFATRKKPVVYRHVDDTGGPVYFQIFTWTSEEAVGQAHHSPEVMKSWGAMDPLCEERGGRGKWEFPHVDQVRLW
jgi:hypothetical protein